jgi:hypothetical protein
MARIPEEVIERLKEEVALQRLVELAGVELRRQGKDFVGRCPFHEDRSPSLVISPEKNLWHCMGACQAGGSVIDWVIELDVPSVEAPLCLAWLDRDTCMLAALPGRRDAGGVLLGVRCVLHGGWSSLALTLGSLHPSTARWVTIPQ